MKLKSKAELLSKNILRFIYQLKDTDIEQNIDFPLHPVLPLPEGVAEPDLRNFLEKVAVGCTLTPELINYCKHDFKRFVYTYGLLKDLEGKCLELGANPYFTTFLIREFTNLELTLSNYFDSSFESEIKQSIRFQDFNSKEIKETELSSYHFNIEMDPFPFGSESFDVVLFCEIIEHLLMDPVKVLREIKRVLKPGGTLILTTPNVARLENVAKLLLGENISDQYSGYGSYGRHNREYNIHDLNLLLGYLGFTIETLFTADVHENHHASMIVGEVAQTLARRRHDVGQYIFIKAINSREAGQKKPDFLYRSYPPNELETSFALATDTNS